MDSFGLDKLTIMNGEIDEEKLIYKYICKFGTRIYKKILYNIHMEINVYL